MVQIRPYDSNFFVDSDTDPSIIPVIVDEHELKQPYAETYNEVSFSQKTRQAAVDILKYKRPNRMHAIALRMMNSFPYRNVVTQARLASKMYECYILTIVDRITKDDSLQVIFMCPTVDLANKIHEQVLKIGKLAEIQSRVVGVLDCHPDSEFGLEEIIIGMPNTIRQLILMKRLNLSRIKMVVVEKADEIVELSMGEDTHAVMCAVDPKCELSWSEVTVRMDIDPKCQFLLFYGTITDKLKEFAEKLDTWKWNRLFVNEEEFCISRVKTSHIMLPDEEKALAIREIISEIPRSIQVIVYVNPKTDPRHLQEALVGFNVAYVPELVPSKKSADQVSRFKKGHEGVLVTCVPPSTGFDESKVHLLIFHDIPMIRDDPDYECYYRLSAQVGRNIYEDEWSDEIGFKGYSVIHLLSEKQDSLMTKTQRHFGRNVVKIHDDMCPGVSKVYRALELGSLVLELSTYKSTL